MLTFFIAYLLCGILIGILAGLFGIGGGVIGVPLLVVLFTIQGIPHALSVHMAIATLLATVIVTSLSSIYSHYRKGVILISVFKKIIWGSLVGSIIGILISNHLSGFVLQRIFGLMLLLVALRMLMEHEFTPKREFPNEKKIFVATTLLGTISSMLGLGGGVLMVPFLNWCGIPIRNAIATATACIFPVAIVGTIGYTFFVDHPVTAGAVPSGFVYWPAFFGISITSVMFAPLGVKMTHSISPESLKKYFSGFLFIMGLAMLI